jgi:UDP-GlcNAc:undecaprenyl-phosphate GlcNAc-1-phosphate transferase
LAILALPLLDSCFAIIRRKLTGRSIYATDRAHLHHTLRNRGLGDRGLLLTVFVLSVITAAGALAGQMLGRDWLAVVSVCVVIGLLIATKAFGYAEVVLLARRANHFAISMFEPALRAETSVREKTVRLQGTRQWETVWETLVEFAESHELCKVHMDLNVPWLEEGFHGTWQRSKMPERHESWTTALPIYADGRIAGRLDIAGPAREGQAVAAIGKLVELIEDLIPQIELLMAPQALVAEPKLISFSAFPQANSQTLEKSSNVLSPVGK